MVIHDADIVRPVSCLMTNLSNTNQTLIYLQNTLESMKEVFVILNGDCIAENIVLESDAVSSKILITIADVHVATVNLSTGAMSIADVFDPINAQYSIVTVIFNSLKPYKVIISEFFELMKKLREKNKNIHCVFLQNSLE